MRSLTTRRFRETYAELPDHIQRRARTAYRLFERDPSHPSLAFKKVHPERPIYSARVSLGYRALGVLEDDALIWFWIGSHSDYEELLSRL